MVTGRGIFICSTGKWVKIFYVSFFSYYIFFFFIVLKNVYLQATKSFDKENKAKKLFDGGRSFLILFFEQISSLQFV